MRDVFEAAEQGNERASLALDIFARRVRKYIGAYLVQVGRCDALVFTGGIGENTAGMREMILSGLEHLGIAPDKLKNDSLKLTEGGTDISAADSRTAILVIPTNEELAIARDTYALIGDSAERMCQ